MAQARVRVTVNGKRILRSHAVWNDNHPEDPILPGEVVHHDDENKKNDLPGNLLKMTDAKHRALHGKVIGKKLVQWMRDNPDKCSENVKRQWASRREKGTDSNPGAFGGREARIARNKARKGEKRTPEQKARQSQGLKDAFSKRTPEWRSEKMRRAWETRRKNAPRG